MSSVADATRDFNGDHSPDIPPPPTFQSIKQIPPVTMYGSHSGPQNDERQLFKTNTVRMKHWYSKFPGFHNRPTITSTTTQIP